MHAHALKFCVITFMHVYDQEAFICMITQPPTQIMNHTFEYKPTIEATSLAMIVGRGHDHDTLAPPRGSVLPPTAPAACTLFSVPSDGDRSESSIDGDVDILSAHPPGRTRGAPGTSTQFNAPGPSRSYALAECASSADNAPSPGVHAHAFFQLDTFFILQRQMCFMHTYSSLPNVHSNLNSNHAHWQTSRAMLRTTRRSTQAHCHC